MSNNKHFTPIFTCVLYSKEWKELTKSEMILYLYLKAGNTGTNNGDITLPYVSMKGLMNTSTIAKSIKTLIRKGWIERTHVGGLMKNASRYKLTYKNDKALQSSKKEKRNKKH